MKISTFRRASVFQDTSDLCGKPPKNTLPLLVLVLLEILAVCVILTGSTFNADITPTHWIVNMIGRQK